MPRHTSALASGLALIGRMRRSESGNVGIVFGLAIMPLMLAAGAAVDYSRAGGLLSRLQAGTDATVLTLCQASPTIATSDLRNTALASVQGYVGAKGTVTIEDLQVTNSPRTVTLKTNSSVNTAVLRIVNTNTIPVRATAGCSASENYYEIALVLDTTGSMNSSAGSGQPSKLDSAKTAAKNFVDYMYSSGALPGHVRMSLVPFAASVAIPTASRTASWLDTTGVNPLHWQYVSNLSGQNLASRLTVFNKLKNTNSDWDWAGCVESPPYPYNVKDDPVSIGTPKSMIVPFFAPDEESSYAPYQYRGNTYYAQDTSNLNSYIDDGSAFGTGSCRSDDSSDSKRFTQACKYNARNSAVANKPGPNWGCTSRPFSVLGTPQATLKTEIDALSAGGSTNVHEGFMWGWRTISSTSVFSNQTNPPVAYGTEQYTKVIVLMTDGTNQWLSTGSTIGKSYYSAYGYFRNADGTDPASTNSRFIPGRTNLSSDSDGRAAIDELLAQACTNAKTKNVIVYTVGFSVSTDPIDQQGLTLLKNCATGPDYAFVATDSSTIVSAFAKIAQGIGSLRITR